MVERPLVGKPLPYRDHVITATFLGPDLLMQIDGEEQPHFYMDLTGLRKVGMKVVDDKIKARDKK
jgi:hypothetical protein